MNSLDVSYDLNWIQKKANTIILCKKYFYSSMKIFIKQMLQNKIYSSKSNCRKGLKNQFFIVAYSL